MFAIFFRSIYVQLRFILWQNKAKTFILESVWNDILFPPKNYLVTWINTNSKIILAQTPEIEQALRRFHSCGARKSEQTQKDLLIIVNSEPPPFS